MENFDYTKAVTELEELAKKVEDPSVGLDDVDTCIRRSNELIEQCRRYLRSEREKLDTL